MLTKIIDLDVKFTNCIIHDYIFLRCSDHLDLHSFPTRRSSDLGFGGSRAMSCTRPSGRCRSTSARRSCSNSRGVSRTRRRSEEHTSELQSPDHLVCRLLLEKKKVASKTARMMPERAI